MDERRKREDQVTRDDDNLAHLDKEVPEGSTSASDHEKQSISKVVPFSKQPAKVDPIQNTTPKTNKAPKVLQSNNWPWILESTRTLEVLS